MQSLNEISMWTGNEKKKGYQSIGGKLKQEGRTLCQNKEIIM